MSDNYWYSKTSNRLIDLPAEHIAYAIRQSPKAREDFDVAYNALTAEQKVRIDELLTFTHELTPKKDPVDLADARQSRSVKQKVRVRMPRKGVLVSLFALRAGWGVP